jgi:ubiquinone/menaquinone biosynthesis C-methylase UbiE
MAQKESTRECWDKYWAANNLLYVNKIVEVLQPHLKKDMKVIEIGAGSGATSLKLTEYDTNVTCLDYSQNAINLISKNSKNLGTKINVVRGDAFKLPFEDKSFDICFHQGLIEHFRDPAPMIMEQKRILKENGLLLVQVPQRYCIMTIQKHILINLGKWFAGWETEFSPLQLKRLLRSAELVPLKTAGMFRFRNLDRIQMIFFKKRFIPYVIEKLYHSVMIKVEDSSIGPWLGYTLIVLAQKK